MWTFTSSWVSRRTPSVFRVYHLCYLLAYFFITGYLFPGHPDPILAPASVGSVIISEVAWSGTKADPYGEWIELFNNGSAAVDLSGWELLDLDGLIVAFNGVLEPGHFYVLESNNDNAIIDIDADQIFLHTLNNAGETLFLRDSDSALVDSANLSGGEWPAGTAAPDYLSMERASPNAEDIDSQWLSNDLVHNGMDSEGNPISGTPGKANSGWVTMGESVDLEVALSGPALASAGTIITYSIGLVNRGAFQATEILLTDFLPNELTYISDSSGYPRSAGHDHEVAWQVGDLEPDDEVSFDLTVLVGSSASGLCTNTVIVGAAEYDVDENNNSSELTTTILESQVPTVLIDALYYDGYELNDADEAVRLINLSGVAIDLSGWKITDNTSVGIFPPGSRIDPDQGIWLTREAEAFRRQFGFEADFAVENVIGSAAKLDGVWPGFSNAGDEVILLDTLNRVVDVLVYERGDTNQNGWNGAAVAPYSVAGIFAQEGQILYRMRDWKTGFPTPDTNKAADWAQSMGDSLNGRKVRYPGWDLDNFIFPAYEPAKTGVEIFVAPDNAYSALKAEIENAADSIWIETHTFRSYALAQALSDAAVRGIQIVVLLEGSPVGGVHDSEKLNCQIIEEAGGQCWFMISNDSLSIEDRYRYLHAKFMLIDGRRALISSENLSPDSLPDDEKSDGTWGRRGVILVTEAVGVVDGLKAIWFDDLDPANHQDLFRWSSTHSQYGPPAPGTVPVTSTGGTGYSIRFPDVFKASDGRNFTIEQSPENSLVEGWGTISLINRVESGDSILVQQLVEDLHWGSASSDRLQDPNPRLEALIDAARRGARVRILLDGFFSSGIENESTCLELSTIAMAEKLNLECSTANPAGLGIHNKMILIQNKGRGYVHIGSINGTESSHKGNREVALLFQSDKTYEYLSGLFEYDWPHELFLPVITSDYTGPADHLLISEVQYDPAGSDEIEYVEIVNPTSRIIDLSDFSLGDAVRTTDYEDVCRFPTPTLLAPGEVLVISSAGEPFFNRFGFNPDFEIVDTDPAIPDLVDDPKWGEPTALFQLGNQGDEILLRNSSDELIDGIAYGSGYLDGQTSCSLVVTSGRVLERNPYWRDTDDCLSDFINYSLPDPGNVREVRD